MFIAHINDKEIQSCKDHSIGVACIARKKLEGVGLGNTAYLAGVLHDAGKYTDEFKEYIEKAHNNEVVKKGSVIHTFSGCSYILNHFHNDKLEYVDIASEIIAYAIAAHHSLFDCVDEDGNYGFTHRVLKQPDYDKRAMRGFFEECISTEEIKQLFTESVEEIKSKINILFGDNFNGEYNNSAKFFYAGLLSRLVLSSVIDGDRIDTFLFMSGEKIDEEKRIPDWKKCIKHIDEFINQMEINTEIQKARAELSDLCVSFAEKEPNIYRIKLPTGAGKTLSGLRYGAYHSEKYKKKRIFYIAPLISILEQNASVIRNAIGDTLTVLEHHSNIVIEDDDNENGIDKATYKLLTENWDSPIVVTTLVQFLNSLFGEKTSQVRRFSSLVDSVIILDEVQTVPWRILSLFNLTMNFLKKACNATILLCSATQPSFSNLNLKMMVADNNLLTKEQEIHYSKIFKRSEIVYDGSYKLEDISSYIINLSNYQNNILVVCNKKDQAQYLYNKLEKYQGKVFHLSASMCVAHRENTLEKIKNSLQNKEKAICVSTQVIEAGVDISFDSVIRFEAGLDSIVQSNGRCNRNGEISAITQTHIIRCSDEDLSKLEEIRIAKNATTELIEDFINEKEKYHNDLCSDESVEAYYDYLYRSFGERKTHYYDKKSDIYIFDILAGNDLWRSKKSFSDERHYFLNQAFKTAGQLFEPLESDTVSILVPYGDGDEIITNLGSERALFDIQYAKKLIDKAKRYSVSIMKYQAQKLIEQGDLYKIYNNSIFVLRNEFYNKNTGVISRKEVNGECNILIL